MKKKLISLFMVVVVTVVSLPVFTAYADSAAAIFGPGTPIATAAIKILEILMQE